MFVNMQIDIHLEGAVVLQKNKGAFDSFLALLYFNDLKNKKQFDGDYSQKLSFLEMSSCGVYHTSFPVFSGVKYYDKEQLIKKFDHDMYAKYGVLVDKKGDGIGRKNDTTAEFKNGFFSYEKVGVDKITYYVRGDLDSVSRLLKNLKFIGKKSSLGWGSIKHIEITEIEKDFSIIKGAKLMRNVPIKNSFNITGDRIGLFRLTHPYWSKSELVECLMP